ncbi:MAG: hypothetical protein RIC16_03470 [Rhodospirillales bacterium]
MDFKEKVESLASVSERLCDLLAEETSGLKERKLDTMRARIEEKDRLCRAFELLVKGLSKDNGKIGDVDDHTRQMLRETGERLKVLVDANASALKSAIQANEQLMNAIRDAAVECTPKAGNYTRSATISPGSRSAEQTPSPVSYNQVL